MTILRACIVCSRLNPESYCPEHKPEPWANSKRRDRTKLSGSAQQRRAKRIIRRDRTFCHVCGRPGADEADHIIPLAEGGADDASNMAAIHGRPCHRTKTGQEAARARKRNATGARPATPEPRPTRGMRTVSVERRSR